MTFMRDMYVRHFRGTAIGNLVRRLWYWDWRNSARLTSLSGATGQASQFWYRVSYVVRYHWVRAKPGFRWLFESRETSNFTYDLTRRNEEHLAELLAVAVARPSSELVGFIRELHQDEAFKKAVIARVKEIGREGGYDPTAKFGRRVGWYALVRAMKPKVVIETGVEKGLGAMVLCAALLRNAQEGNPGRYYGTDIDPAAGMLLVDPYGSMGSVLYGDSIASLKGLDTEVDIFINDSDHSAAYEAREYLTIESKLSKRAVIIADNAHVTNELLDFSRSSGRHFLFFREEPAEHWYGGAGIGLSFK